MRINVLGLLFALVAVGCATTPSPRSLAIRKLVPDARQAEDPSGVFLNVDPITLDNVYRMPALIHRIDYLNGSPADLGAGVLSSSSCRAR